MAIDTQQARNFVKTQQARNFVKSIDLAGTPRGFSQ